jgi:hypothetical protein
MRSKLSTIAIWGVLAPYLLAVTAGAWFHQHEHTSHDLGVSVSPSTVCHAAGDDAGLIDAAHACQPEPGVRTQATGHTADDCPVCQFLGQKSIPPDDVSFVADAPLVPSASRVLARLAVRLTLSPGPIRAPPVAS